MIKLTQIINNLTVFVAISIKSYDSECFIVSGEVEQNLTGTSTVDFTVDNDDMEQTYETKYSISGSGNQFFGAMAKMHAQATTVALEQAEYYYTLAKQLEDPKVTLKAILRAISKQDFDKALLYAILATNCAKKIRGTDGDTMVTSLIKNKHFDKVIEGLSADNKGSAKHKLLEVLMHKTNIQHKGVMVRPEGTSEAITRTDALVSFACAIRKDIKPSDITQADIWDTYTSPNRFYELAK